MFKVLKVSPNSCYAIRARRSQSPRCISGPRRTVRTRPFGVNPEDDQHSTESDGLLPEDDWTVWLAFMHAFSRSLPCCRSQAARMIV